MFGSNPAGNVKDSRSAFDKGALRHLLNTMPKETNNGVSLEEWPADCPSAVWTKFS